MGGERLEPQNKFLAEIEKQTGVSSRQIEDDLLAEKYKTAEAMAQVLGVDVAAAKRILADPRVQENAMKVFLMSAKAELDLLEIPTLLAIIKAPADYASPDQKRRAAKELRKILEEKRSGPNFNVNVQQNNITQTKGDFEQSVYEVANKRDASD